MNVHLPPAVILGGFAAVVVAFYLWRGSVRRARRIATAARNTARVGTLAGRVLLAAALLGGVQWVLITHPAQPLLTAVTIGLPDALAAFVIVRALTVTTVEEPRRPSREHRAPRERGGRR